ncbi:MAG: sucrase ferredoxin [Kutzneria sp.]|nr:sucrase ferredoxin [Kutzneria sp.]
MHVTETRCAVVSRDLDEDPAGTAPTALSWLCLEQPGPWGPKPIGDSHLDPGVAAELTAKAEGTGVRIVLIRRPGSHADTGRPVPRQVYLASTRPTASWLESAVLTDPKQLLDLDFAAAGAGEPLGFGQRTTRPLLLVCTNGRRDVCCALFGRPAARELAAEFPRQVWETTHLGGHRFAPTALQLPSGYLYGRLETATGRILLASAGAGQMVHEGCRGRSCFSRADQAAELAVRRHTGEVDLDAVVSSANGVVGHRDGRRWRVQLTERQCPPARPSGCGKPAAVPNGFVVDALEPLR